MNRIIIFLVLACVANSKNLQSDDEPFITPEFTIKHKFHLFETYNYHNHPFQNKTLGQIKKLLGLKMITDVNAKAPLGETDLALPNDFNSVNQWPGCVHPIRDQGACGSCWAHAASEVLSDRFCIASSGSVNVVLSPQEMVSCDYFDLGCNGGMLSNSWTYLRYFGIATDGCQPYKSAQGSVPWCPFFSWKCQDGTSYRKYKAKGFYLLPTINQIKANIVSSGPVEAAFYVYSDFMNYKSGVYKRQSNQMLGGHAVKVVGWGVENGVEHWIVANSWGPSWGETGFFRIAFGECGIDGSVIAGDPSL